MKKVILIAVMSLSSTVFASGEFTAKQVCGAMKKTQRSTCANPQSVKDQICLGIQTANGRVTCDDLTGLPKDVCDGMKMAADRGCFNGHKLAGKVCDGFNSAYANATCPNSSPEAYAFCKGYKAAFNSVTCDQLD